VAKRAQGDEVVASHLLWWRVSGRRPMVGMSSGFLPAKLTDTARPFEGGSTGSQVRRMPVIALCPGSRHLLTSCLILEPYLAMLHQTPPNHARPDSARPGLSLPRQTIP